MVSEVYLLTGGSYSEESPLGVYDSLNRAQGQLPVTAVWIDEGNDTWCTYAKADETHLVAGWYTVYKMPFNLNLDQIG